jgi:hypothetical protein
VKGLRHKDDTRIAILDVIEQAERISGYKTTNSQVDNGGEFRNKILEQQLRNNGFCMKETVPRHSETNPVIERINRTIVTMARTALIASDLLKKLWLEAAKHAAYTKNRLPHESLQGRAPLELFRSCNITEKRKFLRAFGETIWAYVIDVPDKFDLRGRRRWLSGTILASLVLDSTGFWV